MKANGRSSVQIIGSAVALLLALAVGASWPTQPALTVARDSDGALVYAERTAAGETFAVRFMHSVHRTPVEEYYRVAVDGDMVLERVVYESYGVGNPSEPGPGETFRMADGKLMNEGMNRRLKSIHLRIGQKLANHELVQNGRSIPLSAIGRPGSRVVIQVKRVSLWSLWAL